MALEITTGDRLFRDEMGSGSRLRPRLTTYSVTGGRSASLPLLRTPATERSIERDDYDPSAVNRNNGNGGNGNGNGNGNGAEEDGMKTWMWVALGLGAAAALYFASDRGSALTR